MRVGIKMLFAIFLLTWKCEENPVVEAVRVENREMLDFLYFFHRRMKIKVLKGISNLPAYSGH